MKKETSPDWDTTENRGDPAKSLICNIKNEEQKTVHRIKYALRKYHLKRFEDRMILWMYASDTEKAEIYKEAVTELILMALH